MDTTPIPVRLTKAVIRRLDDAARRMGTNRAALIRFLIKTFADSFESRGGLSSLPHDWREIMRSLDGRTTSQSQFQYQSLRVAEEPAASPEKFPRKKVTYAKKPRGKKSAGN